MSVKHAIGATVAMLLLAVWPAQAQQPYVMRQPYTLDALNECSALDVAGMGHGVWTVSGTFDGTLTFQVAGEDGTFVTTAVALPATPSSTVTATTAAGTWSGAIAGFSAMRICMTTYVSGSAVVRLAAARVGGGGVGGGGASGEVSISQTGSENDVDLASAIPAGANQIGLVGLTAGDNNVGNIDVASMPADATELPAAAAAADGMANPTAPSVLSHMMCWNGATWDRCATSSTSERYISVGTTEDENEIKATAGVLRSIRARNNHATAVAFLKCTNATAANTTPGSTAIIYDMIIPPTSGMVDGPIDAAFATALTCYLVLGEADTDVAEVAANDVSYTIVYD